jgi:hypothetical protein
MAQLVHLTFVANDAEAELVCGLLRTEGIECTHRPNIGVGDLTGGGMQEVLADEAQLEPARELLDASMPPAE